jgi:hypothetical protein
MLSISYTVLHQNSLDRMHAGPPPSTAQHVNTFKHAFMHIEENHPQGSLTSILHPSNYFANA